MDQNQRLQLQKLIDENNVADNTPIIRELKHSRNIHDDVNKLLVIKLKYGNDYSKIDSEGAEQCNFLYTYYTDIYNKIKKDEIDLNILFEALSVLKLIEDGQIDQHEGSYKFGMLLKKIYIDSAIKKAEKLNNDEESPKLNSGNQELTWSQFKKTLLPKQTKTKSKKKN